jgi:DNA-binding transcriptional LysR family regulator
MGPGASWDALRVFIAVVRAGSFSAAADELGVAQSSVSGQIARLEQTLGHRLLDRSPSGVRATARGRELAARITDAVDRMTIAAGEPTATAPATRTVFVGGPAEFLSEMILPFLPERVPAGLRIAARFGVAETLLEDLRAGTIDVMVSALPTRGPDLSVEPIYDEEFVLVAHPRWVERAAGDIDAVPVLSYGPELPIIRRYWRSVFERRPTALVAAVTAPDLRTLLRLAVQGHGMTVLPAYLVRDSLASGALAQLHVPEVAPLNTLYAATRQRRPLPDPAVAAVREAIVRVARGKG